MMGKQVEDRIAETALSDLHFYNVYMMNTYVKKYRRMLTVTVLSTGVEKKWICSLSVVGIWRRACPPCCSPSSSLRSEASLQAAKLRPPYFISYWFLGNQPWEDTHLHGEASPPLLRLSQSSAKANSYLATAQEPEQLAQEELGKKSRNNSVWELRVSLSLLHLHYPPSQGDLVTVLN